MRCPARYWGQAATIDLSLFNIIIMRKLSVILAFLVLGIIPVFGQEEDCSFTLREANNLYAQGRIENIPAMLEDCIEQGFTSEDRLAAYKLIILCSLYDDEEIQAAAQRGFRRIRLGPRILRTETAALTTLAAVQTLWGDLSS